MNWDMVADIAGFAFGCLLHLGIVVSDWVKFTPDGIGYKDFFKDKKNRAIAVRGGLINIIALMAWSAGLMPGLLSTMGIHFEFLSAAPAVPRFIMAAGWGYAADSFGKRIYRRFEKVAEED
jgi:hypothetical protein